MLENWGICVRKCESLMQYDRNVMEVHIYIYDLRHAISFSNRTDHVQD
jgi:hypothetical protein